MLLYIIIAYMLGMFVSVTRFMDKSYLTVSDLILFTLSPIMVPSVVVLMITSMITDLDKVLFKIDS